MLQAVWNGFLRLSLVFCPIRLSPVASITEVKLNGGDGDNVVEIEHFVPRTQIDQTYIGEAFYVYPESELAGDTLHALQIALLRSGRVALGQAQIGYRERPLIMEPYGAGLLLSTLHPDDERHPGQFVEWAADALPGEMIQIMEDIIARRVGDFPSGQLQRRVTADGRRLDRR
jgi:DNA end-binding protein Ku